MEESSDSETDVLQDVLEVCQRELPHSFASRITSLQNSEPRTSPVREHQNEETRKQIEPHLEELENRGMPHEQEEDTARKKALRSRDHASALRRQKKAEHRRKEDAFQKRDMAVRRREAEVSRRRDREPDCRPDDAAGRIQDLEREHSQLLDDTQELVDRLRDLAVRSQENLENMQKLAERTLEKIERYRELIARRGQEEAFRQEYAQMEELTVYVLENVDVAARIRQEIVFMQRELMDTIDGSLILNLSGEFLHSLAATARRVPPSPPSLSRSKLDALPTTEHKENANDAAAASSDLRCCICLKDFKGGDLKRLLPCDHSFHVKCADKWLRVRKMGYDSRIRYHQKTSVFRFTSLV